MVRRPDADSRPDRPRVFGIGLNKTGTSSFHEALTELGYKSLHYGGQAASDAVMRAVEAEEPLLSNLDQRYDAFSDIGVLSRRFRLLDEQYPGSHFVLTMRPFDEWIDSRRRHVERNIAGKAAGTYHDSFLVIDVDKWTLEWDTHMERAHRYFAGRDDFLEVDLTRDAQWGPLCALLGVAEPDAPFPWSNRDQARHAKGPAST
jgi:hypothetical protein